VVTGNIDLKGGTNTLTITGGTVSGTITGTGGSNTIVVSGGTLNSGITGGAVSDSVAISGGLVKGNIDLGAGNNVFSISGGTVSGTISGAGSNTYNISGGTISGTLGGAGNDTVNILGGNAISGTLDGQGGTNILNLNSTAGYTTNGNIANFQTVNVQGGTATFVHGITGASAFSVAQGAVANINTNESVTNSGAGVTNVSGTLNVAGGKTYQSDNFNFDGGGVLGIAIDSSSSAGKVQIGDASGSFKGGSLTISMGANAGYINSGTQYLLLDSAASGVDAMPSLTTVTQGLYTFQISTTGVSDQDISLTVLRAATASAASNGTTAAIGNVLDTVSSSTNTQLQQIQSLISQQTTTGGVNTVLEKLTPAADTGIALASVDVNVQTGNQVSTRLASLRQQGGTMNTGDSMLNNHMWMNGFGNVSSQDDKDGVKGYDANTYGASAGIDTDTLVDGMTTGLAFSYGRSTVDSNAASGASTDIDNYQITGYGSRVFDGGYFINGQAAVGLAKYGEERNTGIGTASADYDGIQYSAKLEGGKDFTCDWWTFTPLASAQYSFVDLDKYTESGAGALTVDSKNFNVLDLGLGAQVAYNMPLVDGSTLRPVARAKYIYRAGDNTLETNSRFVAGGAAFTTQGVEASRSSADLGAGLTWSTVDGVDLSLDYDADLRSDFVGHTGQIKARWAF
jgi:outer membrane autotransporter protein